MPGNVCHSRHLGDRSWRNFVVTQATPLAGRHMLTQPPIPFVSLQTYSQSLSTTSPHLWGSVSCTKDWCPVWTTLFGHLLWLGGGKVRCACKLCAVVMLCRNRDPYLVVFGASLLINPWYFGGSSKLGIWCSAQFEDPNKPQAAGEPRLEFCCNRMKHQRRCRAHV